MANLTWPTSVPSYSCTYTSYLRIIYKKHDRERLAAESFRLAWWHRPSDKKIKYTKSARPTYLGKLSGTPPPKKPESQHHWLTTP